MKQVSTDSSRRGAGAARRRTSGRPTRSSFLDKLVGRIERLDSESLQAQFVRMARERGLMETVFQSIQEGVLVMAGNATLLYANTAAEQLLSIDARRFQGRSVAQFFPDVEWDRLTRRDESEWEHLFSSEMEVTQPAHRILSLYAAPIDVPAGSADGAAADGDAPAGIEPGAIVILRDVTGDRAQAAQELESERFNAIRSLASSVAHEIGNPLSSLLYRLRLMHDDLEETHEVTDQTFEDLRVAQNEVARIDMIIKQFLGAMRHTAPDFAKGSLRQVVEETLEVMRPELEDRRVAVLLSCPDELPPVYIDANQMKQVFFNILRNALQAMPGGGRLTLSFTADDRTVCVSIRDSGSGIPEAEFRRIFEAYHTTKQGGNGIGLMIVQRIVRDHGGLVEVASKQGEGTVFRIVLPLADRRIRLLTTK